MTKDVARPVDRVDDRSPEDPPDGMHSIRERCDDSEVPPAATDRPEQVRLLRGARFPDPAVRGDDLGLEQVVAREPVLSHQDPETTPEGESRDPRVRHDPAR